MEEAKVLEKICKESGVSLFEINAESDGNSGKIVYQGKNFHWSIFETEGQHILAVNHFMPAAECFPCSGENLPVLVQLIRSDTSFSCEPFIAPTNEMAGMSWNFPLRLLTEEILEYALRGMRRRLLMLSVLYRSRGASQ